MEEVAPREFIKRLGIKSLICCFSGGRDSLVSTHYVLEHQGLKHREDLEIHVVLVDTTVMIPMVVAKQRTLPEIAAGKRGEER